MIKEIPHYFKADGSGDSGSRRYGCSEFSVCRQPPRGTLLEAETLPQLDQDPNKKVRIISRGPRSIRTEVIYFADPDDLD